MIGSHHEVAPDASSPAVAATTRASAKPLLPAAVLLRRRLVPSWAAVAVSPAGCATPSLATPAGRSNRHGTPYSHCSRTPGTRRARRRRVSFSSPVSLYVVTPYEECYGLHPSQFNFDDSGCMAPLSPEGWSPAPEPHACDDQVKIAVSSPLEAEHVETSPSTQRSAVASTSLRWADMLAVSPIAGVPLAASGSSSSMDESIPCPSWRGRVCQSLGVPRGEAHHATAATSLSVQQLALGRTSPSCWAGGDPSLGSDSAGSTLIASKVADVTK